MHNIYQNQGHVATLGGTINSARYKTDPKKYPNLPPPANVPIHTECRILKHVVASAAESEVGGLLQNGKTEVPLRIKPHELGFTQPPTPIKTDNSAAKGIVTATVRQKGPRQPTYDFIG